MAFVSAVVDNLVHKLADAFEFDLHRISGLEENRRLALEANTCRRAHRDDVTRFEVDELRKMIDDEGNVEMHRRGVGVLLLHSVDAGDDLDTMRVGELILGDNDRTERVAIADLDGMRVMPLSRDEERKCDRGRDFVDR